MTIATLRSTFVLPGMGFLTILAIFAIGQLAAEDNWHTPYSAPQTQRENVFAFTQSPQVKYLGNDRFKITFAVKGYCDVTVALVDKNNHIVRHLASGVLGKNAPLPFQKNALNQEIFWDGKNDLHDYVKKPEVLRIRVSLGLKPVFDKRLGGSSPYHLAGLVWGIAVDSKRAYVFIKGEDKVTLRTFDHDGNYIQTLLPPPANFPQKKLEGMGAIEYEPKKFSYHSPKLDNTTSTYGVVLPGSNAVDAQVAIVGNRIFYCNGGVQRLTEDSVSRIYYINTDGSTTLEGTRGLPFTPKGLHANPQLAASSDGKWLYFVGLSKGYRPGIVPVVLKRSMEPTARASLFIGKSGKKTNDYVPGSSNDAFNNPAGIDCDTQDRVYVADRDNNRIQIFSSKGTHLKTIKIDRPKLIRIHRKSGAIFVSHEGRQQGKSIARLTKYTSFDKPVKEYHVDHFPAAIMTLDSFSKSTRIWVGGQAGSYNRRKITGPGLTIWEEHGKGLKKIRDFDAEGRKAAGKSYFGRFSGGGGTSDKLVCDPVREQAYYRNSLVFDLKTGDFRGHYHCGRKVDDIAFDKRGYLHAHLNAGGGVSVAKSGVLRQDPAQAKQVNLRGTAARDINLHYPEIPYDYGIQKPNVGIGIIPVKDQGGGKHFLNGIGVNMAGDIAESCRIVNVPKFQATAAFTFGNGLNSGNSQGPNSYAFTLRSIQAEEKKGNAAYSITRRPGVPLAGGTIWTWNRHGELLQECAVLCGGTTNGSTIDEDRKVTFVIGRYGYTRMIAGKPFLHGRGGLFGTKDSKTRQHPFTGTLIKSNGGFTVFKKLNATIKMTESDIPKRKTDLGRAGQVGRNKYNGGEIWVENAEWLYAGASPVMSHGCECPTSRFHLDWFKRTFVSESYRHSIGVLDTAGNLIMHLGQYGNFDSISGPKSKVPLDGDGIGVFIPRFISGTDTYLAFHDWGERIVVLKIDYHTQQSVAIKMK